ncbi:Lumazine-binding protein [Chytriomyces sp. MP71]|nr:Lumazine-binding protein [Chytriomyces sp. MP71]
MVFTGIVECMGVVSSVLEVDNTWGGGRGLSMTFSEAGPVLVDVNLGDSIMVNGICLTVTEFDTEGKKWFKAGIAPETSRRTNCADWRVGTSVNLERAMNGATRYGGHVVQGHVDCTVTLVAKTPDPPNSLILTFRVPERGQLPIGNQENDPLTYIIAKGYVCLNGTSLTVINVDRTARTFAIMLVAYTQAHVNLPHLEVNSRINLEVDEIAKYIESVVRSVVVDSSRTDDGVFSNAIKRMVDNAVDERLVALGLLKK